MTDPSVGPEFRRFPFFGEQKADPNASEGNIFSASITRLRVNAKGGNAKAPLAIVARASAMQGEP